MEEAIELDTDIFNQVLLNKIAQAAVRETQQEAAIQQLLQEKARLEEQLSTFTYESTDVKEEDG